MIIAWIPFTVNQISETISHLNGRVYLLLMKIEITESQIKFRKKSDSIVQIDSENLDGDICFNDEYWASVKAEFAPNKKYITLIFPQNHLEMKLNLLILLSDH